MNNNEARAHTLAHAGRGARTREEKMLLSGAQILVNCLAEQGVFNIFGYPGASILSVYDALTASSVKHVLAAHEQGACFAAEGYARRSGKAGVVLATSGPGATNLVTGIADAYMDSVPLVAITGNVSLDKLGHDSFQEVDIFDVTMPVSKYGMIVKRAGEIAPAVRRAFALAESGRRGPVLVDIPSNVFDEYAEYTRETPVRPSPRSPLDDEIARAAEMLNAAKKPVLYIGGGVRAAGAADKVAELAARLRCPVAVTYMGLGCFDPDSDKFLGVLSAVNGLPAAAIRECDLFVTVGARFNSRYGAFGALKKRRIPVLQFDSDRAEIDKNVLAAHAVVGDAALSLAKLLPLVDEKEEADWEYPALPDMREVNRGTEIISALSRKTGRRTTVVTDVGLHQEWAAHNCKIYTPERFLTSGGLGAMGFGLGAAIGAHFASGDPCLLITGDGSFNMINNNSLGMIRKLQAASRSKSNVNAPYLNVDYAALARSLGARGVTVSETDDIESAIDDALDGPLPVVIDFRIPINTGI